MTRTRKTGGRRVWFAPLSALILLCCQGTIGDPGEDPDGPGNKPGTTEPKELTLQSPVLPKLTTSQYQNAVRDLLGDNLPEPPLEADTNPYLFYSIGAASTSVSEVGTQLYEEAADELASAVFADPARRTALVGCEPTTPTDGCVASFVASFGRRVYRRPLNDAEVTRWLGVSSDLAEGGDAWQGLQMVVSGLLQSPNFLYRVELGEADPDDENRLRYSAYEMASRLSFTLRNTIPDDELLDAAEDGSLLTDEGVDAQARRLLEGDRARDNIQEFFSQYFDLGRLDGLSRDVSTYPLFTPGMPEAMRTEVKLLVDDFVNRRDTDVRGVFTSQHTFVNSELAALYELDAPGATPVTFVPVDLPEDGVRRGLLTMGAFLAMNAHETETSPTLRGKYLRERVFCEDVPPPPDDIDIDITEEPGEEPKTLRERLEEHRENPACRGCHEFVDPPGMLFENYDSVGAWRTDDNGYPIDASGGIDGKDLENARELADVLVDDDRLGRCIVRQVFRHAQSRLDGLGEERAIDDLQGAFSDNGYRFRELLVSLVTHESFRYVSTTEVTP